MTASKTRTKAEADHDRANAEMGEKLDTVKAPGTKDAPIHLEATSSPQGSLTAPRPGDGTDGGANNLLDPATGGHVERPGDEANISGV